MTRLLFVLLMGCLLHPVSAQVPEKAPPDFAIRAFHLDLRIQVMTMPALEAFAQQLHDEGFNALIMEYEGSYPFKKHPLIPNRFAYTREEIVSFVAFCHHLGIEVIPLQQSFGHVEYILRHQRYAALREDQKDLSQVCPLATARDSGLFTDLYTELAATHPAPYIHIGCDETHLLGHCPLCRRKAATEGYSRLYIDYVRMLCNIVIRLGKRPVLWADIALKYPEALQSLPRQTIFVDWNYGWDLNHFGDHSKLLRSGFEIWGAPALRSSPDNYFLTQWEKHFNNIFDFVPQARQMGYKGMVLTSWSTSGAYSYLYESENSLTELYAIRHVYPITGFHILIDAFAKSIRSRRPLQTDDFVRQFAIQRYGFTPEEAKRFWKALRAAPYEVREGVVQAPGPVSLEALTDSIRAAAETFHGLVPLRNQLEYDHYQLMTDIRLQYLEFLLVEKEVNGNQFTEADVPSALQKLKDLMDRETGLDRRFVLWNKDVYYTPELYEENRIRGMKLHLLYERLKGIHRPTGDKP